jgi:hypothetical protein
MTLMTKVLCPYLGKFVVKHLDDTMIYSEEEHLQYIILVLEVLGREKLNINLKCKFFKQEMICMGFVILMVEIKNIDPEKVKVIMDWLVMHNGHEVSSVHGIAKFCRKSIRGFSGICIHLTKCLQWNCTFVTKFMKV